MVEIEVLDISNHTNLKMAQDSDYVFYILMWISIAIISLIFICAIILFCNYYKNSPYNNYKRTIFQHKLGQLTHTITNPENS